MIVLNKPKDNDSVLLRIEYPEVSLDIKKSFFEDFKMPDYNPKNKGVDYVSIREPENKYQGLRLSFGYNWGGSFENGFMYVTSLHLMHLEDRIYPKSINIFELESLVYTDKHNYLMYRQYIAYDFSECIEGETQTLNIHKLFFQDGNYTARNWVPI